MCIITAFAVHVAPGPTYVAVCVYDTWQPWPAMVGCILEAPQ